MSGVLSKTKPQTGLREVSPRQPICRLRLGMLSSRFQSFLRKQSYAGVLRVANDKYGDPWAESKTLCIFNIKSIYSGRIGSVSLLVVLPYPRSHTHATDASSRLTELVAYAACNVQQGLDYNRLS